MQHVIKRHILAKSICDFWFETPNWKFDQSRKILVLSIEWNTALIFMKSSNSKMDQFLLLLLWTKKDLLPIPIYTTFLTEWYIWGCTYWKQPLYRPPGLTSISWDLLGNGWFIHLVPLICAFVFFCLCVSILGCQVRGSSAANTIITQSLWVPDYLDESYFFSFWSGGSYSRGLTCQFYSESSYSDHSSKATKRTKIHTHTKKNTIKNTPFCSQNTSLFMLMHGNYWCKDSSKLLLLSFKEITEAPNHMVGEKKEKKKT